MYVPRTGKNDEHCDGDADRIVDIAEERANSCATT